jgi:hypothetical protein
VRLWSPHALNSSKSRTATLGWLLVVLAQRRQPRLANLTASAKAMLRLLTMHALRRPRVAGAPCRQQDQRELRRQRKRLRDLAAQDADGEALIDGEDVEDMCRELGREAIAALCVQLEAADGEDEMRGAVEAAFRAMCSTRGDVRALLSLLRMASCLHGSLLCSAASMWAKVAFRLSERKAQLEQRAARSAQLQQRQCAHSITSALAETRRRCSQAEVQKQQAKAAAAAEARAKRKAALKGKVASAQEWSEEEVRMLDKALVKFPVGVPRRWEQVTQYVRTRTQDEVLFMVKARSSCLLSSCSPPLRGCSRAAPTTSSMSVARLCMTRGLSHVEIQGQLL